MFSIRVKEVFQKKKGDGFCSFQKLFLEIRIRINTRIGTKEKPYKLEFDTRKGIEILEKNANIGKTKTTKFGKNQFK